MQGLQRFGEAHATALALTGSILMFLGWVLAIVPTFHDLANVWVVVLLALIAFAVVLIPPGVDIFARPGAPGQKRGLVPTLIAAVPAALLFIVAAAELPLSASVRALAIVLELVGMAVYLWAWECNCDATSHA